eukprot:SM006038S19301  [mRNA]  locus=s6038:96:528:- [translate_table: standard]
MAAGKLRRDEHLAEMLRRAAGLLQDKVTVVISGYSKERIPLMAELVHAYAEMPFVHAVLVLWHNAADPLVGGSDPHNISHLLTDTRSRRPPLSPFR